MRLARVRGVLVLLVAAGVIAWIGVPAAVSSAAVPITATAWVPQSPTTSPPGRFDASMAFDPAIGEIVLFGGVSAGGVLDDTWTYDGLTWTRQSPAVSPSARFGASMA